MDDYALDAVLSFALNFGDIDSADQFFEQRRGQGTGAIWRAMGYTVLLCFCLIKTGSISNAVFGAH